ncbi:UDP-GalNAc:beta-1,3-N-acetylgalactosaminyltransferase 1 [Lamellibrachia satsuma]|nr:UDP-GalNAc:beta-1,3-N-acetylgalactosaminyltransferase 1 [Lamellibrachia satsuma]
MYPPALFIRSIKYAALVVSSLLCVVGLLTVCVNWSTTVNLEYAMKNCLCDGVNTAISSAQPLWQTCKELERLESAYYRRRSHKINNVNYTYLIPGDDICTNDTHLVILVHSLHNHADRRDAIRKTWGGAAVAHSWPGRNISVNVKLAFIFGVNRDVLLDSSLKDEHKRYGDIIQCSFYEHYHNMTLKSLLGLRWNMQYCPNAKFLLKSDDDMIVNIPYLLTILNHTDMHNSIMGPHNERSRVYRHGKWAISKTHYPFYHFPPYESGSAYVISADLVRPLYETSQYVPHIFIDDVYVTGILGRIVGARHVVQDGFAFWTSNPPRPCDIEMDRVVTGTGQTASSLRLLWTALHQRKTC